MSRAPDWSLAATAYDSLAPRYDAVPVENRINAYMRRASLARLSATFRPGQRVLEVGCGTGDEALALGARGVHIVAVDASKEMIRRAREKMERRGLGGEVAFLPLAARDLVTLESGARGGFDGAYASFSLAYEPDLAPVAVGLDALLAADAPFLASVPSRVCLVELVAAFAAGRPWLAGRRFRAWHGHKVGAYEVPIRTYTPAELTRAMAPHFVLQRIEALPAILPPPYANRAYVLLHGLADGLERIDAIVRTRAPFRSVGDHVLAEFRHIHAANP